MSNRPTDAGTRTVADIHRAMRQIAPKIIESPWVPEGQVYIFNDLGLPDRPPDDWESLPAEEKLRWAVEHGHAIVIRNVGP